MTETQKIKTGINNISAEWFRAKIDRKKLKELSRRNNYEGWKHIIIFTLTMLLLGTLSIYTWGTIWFVPIYLIYCMFWGGADAIWHECGHRTAFKTRKLNDIIGYICGFSIILPHQHFRYEHCDHHTYTNLKGKDPELIQLPISLYKYIWYISSVSYWKNKFSEIFRHVFGQLSDDEKIFIPRPIANPIIKTAITERMTLVRINLILLRIPKLHNLC